MSPVQTSIFSPARGWRNKSPTKAAALRALLSDGRWHSQKEMADVAGYRYGAALFIIHNEISLGDGLGPVHYQKDVCRTDDTRVRYRQIDKGACDICTKEAKRKPADIIKDLARRLSELETENARLKSRLAYAEGQS